jgi:glutaminase
MVCRHNDELEAFCEEAKKVTDKGEVASIFPLLAKADRRTIYQWRFIIPILCLSAGDVEKTFTLQSISKVFPLRSC